MGSSVGEVHAAILKAFGCDGAITDGAVRDLPAVSEMQFPLFAPYAAVSHSYSHIVEFGGKVSIFGLEIACGDLVMADCHGALSIPAGIAADVARAAKEMYARERSIVAICQSPGFSRDELREALRGAK